MALTVNAAQLTMANRSRVECVPLVVLETFTDRDAETVAATRYYTRTGRAVLYKWDGVNDQAFEPLLEFVSPIDRGFDHMPDAGSYSTRDAINLEFDSSPRVGEYLWQSLLDENIIGARVTIASILIEPEFTSHDLGFAAAVHVIRWRGEVTRLTGIKAEATAFTLVCESQEAKLGSTVFISGEQSADLPVIIDSAAGIRCYPNTVRNTGKFVESVISPPPPDERVSVTLDGGSVVPVLFFNDGWTAPSSSHNNNIGYAVTQNGTRMNSIEYELLTDPGVNGSPEVDLTHTDRVDAFSLVNDPVYFPTYMQRWTLAAGRVRSLSEFRITRTLGGSGTTMHLSSAGDGTDWKLYIDESDPDNVVSYIDFYPNTMLQLVSASQEPMWLRLLWHESVTLEADIESMWDAPSGSWTTELDPATYTLTDGRTSRGASDGANRRQTNTVTHLGLTSDSLTALTRDGSNNLVITTTSTTAVSTGVDFRNMSPTAGDREFRFTIAFDVTQLSRLVRVFVQAWTTSIVAIDERRGTQRHGVYSWEASELSVGDNVLDGIYSMANDPADVLDRFSITCQWNNTTTNKTFWVSDVIESRPLTEIAAQNHPLDLTTVVVETYLPADTLSIDTGSFTTAETNTPGINITPDLSLYPSLGEFLAAVGFAGRVNFAFAESTTSTVLKAFAAEADYDFPAASRAIGDVFTDMQLTLRPLTEIANRFTWLYDLTEGEDNLFIENYRSSIRATALDNPYSPSIATADFTTAEAAFGKREAIVIPIPMIRDETSILATTGYYVKESLRGQVARYSCLVPYWIGYDLEPGDVVSIQPSWESSVVKTRILRTVFSFDEHGVGFVLEEVT